MPHASIPATGGASSIPDQYPTSGIVDLAECLDTMYQEDPNTNVVTTGADRASKYNATMKDAIITLQKVEEAAKDLVKGKKSFLTVKIPLIPGRDQRHASNSWRVCGVPVQPSYGRVASLASPGL